MLLVPGRQSVDRRQLNYVLAPLITITITGVNYSKKWIGGSLATSPLSPHILLRKPSQGYGESGQLLGSLWATCPRPITWVCCPTPCLLQEFLRQHHCPSHLSMATMRHYLGRSIEGDQGKRGQALGRSPIHTVLSAMIYLDMFSWEYLPGLLSYQNRLVHNPSLLKYSFLLGPYISIIELWLKGP